MDMAEESGRSPSGRATAADAVEPVPVSSKAGIPSALARFADHPSTFIREEMEARGWDEDTLAIHMGGDFGINRLMIDVYFIVGPERTNCRIGEKMASQLGLAFDVSPQFLLNLEQAWLHAQAIEAARAAETGEDTGSVHESAVPQGCAQTAEIAPQ